MALSRFYAATAAAGLVGTWWFNVQSMRAGDDYLAGWFANPAASSAAVDLIVVALVACVFFVVEGRRADVPHAWVFVPLTFLVALAATLPAFLAVREHRRARGADPAEVGA